MNAPIIWVFLPIFSGILIWFIRERDVFAKSMAVGMTAFLFILSQLLPIDTLIDARLFTFEISSEMNILGRILKITSVDLSFVSLFYGFALFWLIGSFFLRINRHFPAVSLVILGLMVAAISVEPFLYAALIIELVVLVTIPIFIQPGKPIGKGLIRFLQFQTLAMPLILYAGWTILGVEANRSNEIMIQQTVVALGLGFALWLAVFPFYSWIPLLSAQSEPYSVGFFLLFYPMTTLHLGLKFINTYSWLRENILLQDAIQGAGILLILTGGILAINQRNLRKLFGYLVMMENGFSLLAISLDTAIGFQLYFAAMFPRLLMYALWSFTTSKHADQSADIAQKPIKHGMYAFVLFFTLLASIGFPLIGNGPLRTQIVYHFEGKILQMGFILAGMLGYGFGVLRTMNEMSAPMLDWLRNFHIRSLLRLDAILLGIGLLLIGIVGVYPTLFGNASNLLIQIYDKLIA